MQGHILWPNMSEFFQETDFYGHNSPQFIVAKCHIIWETIDKLLPAHGQYNNTVAASHNTWEDTELGKSDHLILLVKGSKWNH